MSGSKKKGRLIIFSAPSGAGKTTLVQYAMAHIADLTFSVSACSRGKRPNETEGKDYYFITVDQFIEKIKHNEFVEWEEVYPDHYYGTLYTEVNEKRDLGKHVVFDVDVIGGLNIKKIFKDFSVRELGSGLANRNYLIKSGSELYNLRTNRLRPPMKKDNLRNEHLILEFLAKKNIPFVSRSFYYDKIENIHIVKFIP